MLAELNIILNWLMIEKDKTDEIDVLLFETLGEGYKFEELMKSGS